VTELDSQIYLLKSRKLNSHIVKIISEWNSDNTTFIKIRNNFTKKMSISIGIKQGDILSSVLSNIIMDKIIKEVKGAGREYRIENKEIKIICYADDAVIISGNGNKDSCIDLS